MKSIHSDPQLVRKQRISDCAFRSPSWFRYSAASTLKAEGTLQKRGWKVGKRQKMRMCFKTVLVDVTGMLYPSNLNTISQTRLTC